jgi:acyl-CoA thioester hydrolase
VIAPRSGTRTIVDEETSHAPAVRQRCNVRRSGFLDPLYSFGVLLALKSGEVPADAIADGLAKRASATRSTTASTRAGRRGIRRAGRPDAVDCSRMPDRPAFRYRRRVHFAETDMAGIVHFSVFFRYMEEAEHALWRAAGLVIARPGEVTGWPRVATSFDFKAPLRFEDECDVDVRVGRATPRTLQYEFVLSREGRTIGTGTVTTAFVSKRPGEPMKALDLPADVVDRLRAAVGQA